MKRGIASIILRVNWGPACNEIFHQIQMSLLTSHVETVAAPLVGDTHQLIHVLKVSVHPFHDTFIASITCIMQRCPIYTQSWVTVPSNKLHSHKT